ncbi:plasmid stabilization system [Flavobacterium sp. ZT3R18]|nr:plasmid stabilization system [Flavobacterium sp. ZT3R18]
MEVEFAFTIEKAIEQILKMPSAYSTRYKNVRIAHPKIFPYNIHFYIDETTKTVVFTAIIHNKRNPKLAISRIV